jgi:hypothetical protein
MKSNTVATNPGYLPTQPHTQGKFSLTPRFSGVGMPAGLSNRFNGFAPFVETVETVSGPLPMANTSLKRGVNERPNNRRNRVKLSKPRALWRLKAILLLLTAATGARPDQKTKTNKQQIDL